MSSVSIEEPEEEGLGGVADWTVEEVCLRLHQEPWASQDFINLLEYHQVDGEAILELTKEDLREDFGMKKLGEIKSVLRHVRQMHTKLGGKLPSLPVGAFGASMSNSHTLGASLSTAEQQEMEAAHEWELAHTNSNSNQPKMNITYKERKGQGKVIPKRFQQGTAKEMNALAIADKERMNSVTAGNLGDSVASAGQIELTEGDRDSSWNPSESQSSVSMPPIHKPTTDAGNGRASAPPILLSPLPDSPTGDKSFNIRGVDPLRRQLVRNLAGLSATASEFGGSASGMTTTSTVHSADTATLKASSVDLVAARQIKRKRRERERRERLEADARGEVGSAKFDSGLLERERRQDALAVLFRSWTGTGAGDREAMDDSDMEVEVDLKEVQEVLDIFYRTSEDGQDQGLVASRSDAQLGEMMGKERFSQVVDSFTHHLTPTLFDDVINFFYSALGDLEGKKEAARRFNLLQDLFRVWDVHNFGVITAEELRETLTKFNDNAEEENEDWLVFDLHKLPDPSPDCAALGVSGKIAIEDHQRPSSTPELPTLPSPKSFLPTRSQTPDPEGLGMVGQSSEQGMDVGDSAYGPQEFIDGMITLMERFGREDFDAVYYRLMQLVQSQQGSEMGAVVPRPLLQRMYIRSLPSNIFFFYGLRTDMSSQVEELADENQVRFKGVVVASAKSEAAALKLVQYSGLNRGWWIYCMVAGGYTNSEGFLRAVAVLLQTKQSWMMHSTFRLFLSLPVTSPHTLPSVLRVRALPLDLREYKTGKKRGKQSGTEEPTGTSESTVDV